MTIYCMAQVWYTEGVLITSMLQDAGEMVAIIDVFVRPPNESCNNLVNLLSL